MIYSFEILLNKRCVIKNRPERCIIDLSGLFSYSLILGSIDSYSIPAKHLRTASKMIFAP